MKNRTVIIILLVPIIAAGAGYYLWGSVTTDRAEPAAIAGFEDCAKYYAILESYPRQCKTPDGTTFVEKIGNELEKQNLIRVASPRRNAAIASPLRVLGEARGTWYFEASFPVELLDQNGKRIAIQPAQAKGEWMTTEFVPFEVTLTFSAQPTGGTGTLILRKDNPSGLPEHDDALTIPITF